MIFSCTQKVIEKTKKHYNTEKEKAEVGANNWYVNLLTIGRKKGLLFVHSETLYMTFIEDSTIKTIKNLQFIFINQLREDLMNADFDPSSVDAYLSSSPSLQICKTNSRRVLGVMNEIIYYFPMYFERESSRNELLKLMNGILYTYPGVDKKKEYRYPVKEMEKLLSSIE
ncbi:DUF6933 domain-containing protein [Flammeovirga aprica]|uniref:DUF6933 domain-containing protein n=1 Tax=Flammeovirga aprica JL-4 TaxID=694437 RepID=A0A7X9S1Z6_9BACT|nr:hypothetical protein [Flammeovirga aprica]NME72819.1 hypothetical protein [Flammeovirga aprica JL-4]